MPVRPHNTLPSLRWSVKVSAWIRRYHWKYSAATSASYVYVGHQVAQPCYMYNRLFITGVRLSAFIQSSLYTIDVPSGSENKPPHLEMSVTHMAAGCTFATQCDPSISTQRGVLLLFKIHATRDTHPVSSDTKSSWRSGIKVPHFISSTNAKSFLHSNKGIYSLQVGDTVPFLLAWISWRQSIFSGSGIGNIPTKNNAQYNSNERVTSWAFDQCP